MRRPVNCETLKQAEVVLRALVPLAHPCRIVRTGKLVDAWGSCEFKENPSRFLIRIAKGVSVDQEIETLCHEWAHCRAWIGQTHAHSAYWGVAFSEAYQAVFDE
jgi:hypothetical protein